MALRQSAGKMDAAKVALGSGLVSLAVLALKFGAYCLTGSVALLSDALESIVNVATAVAAWIALRVSARPPDKTHPFGHSKAEYFSAVIEGVLIVVAAIFILREAYSGFLHPKMPEAPWMGLAVNGVATMGNALWGLTLLRLGDRARSPALVADGRHLLADVVTSGGVLAGVALTVLTGRAWLDPLLAAAVAVYILWSGWRLVRESVGGLMDEAVPPELESQIRRLVAEHAEGALEAHALRTRRAGPLTFIEFHLVVPGDLTVKAAHEICDRLEEALRAEVKGCRVMIHVEPEGKAEHRGILVL